MMSGECSQEWMIFTLIATAFTYINYYYSTIILMTGFRPMLPLQHVMTELHIY
jgi:hypothetical protein